VPSFIFAALISLLAVGAERSTVLRPGSVAAMIPAAGGCSVISGGDLLPGRRFLELERGRACSALNDPTWRERSSIRYRSAVLSGGGTTLARADWCAASETRSAQRAAASKLPLGWPT
jgi:hypothetical protein